MFHIFLENLMNFQMCTMITEAMQFEMKEADNR